MILFDEKDTVSLSDFGIQIPVHYSKAGTTLDVLRKDPVLGPRVGKWQAVTQGRGMHSGDLLRAHSSEYVHRLMSGDVDAEVISTYELVNSDGTYHRYDPTQATRPLSGVVDRALARVRGTYECCRMALERDFCFYLGGGMHHAQPDRGKGFCLINDVVISLRKLQAEGAIRSAWVIDVDAHKGDGTAVMTADDPSIITLSAHMATGWPLDEPEYQEDGSRNPSFTPSDIDIPVHSGEEASYTQKLESGLQLLDRAGQPDVALVVMGADPFELDELESTQPLRLTLAQLLVRDQLIFHFLKERDVPMACLMAGGYGRETWRVYTQFLKWALREELGI